MAGSRGHDNVDVLAGGRGLGYGLAVSTHPLDVKCNGFPDQLQGFFPGLARGDAPGKFGSEPLPSTWGRKQGHSKH